VTSIKAKQKKRADIHMQ